MPHKHLHSSHPAPKWRTNNVRSSSRKQASKALTGPSLCHVPQSSLDVDCRERSKGGGGKIPVGADSCCRGLAVFQKDTPLGDRHATEICFRLERVLDWLVFRDCRRAVTTGLNTRSRGPFQADMLDAKSFNNSASTQTSQHTIIHPHQTYQQTKTSISIAYTRKNPKGTKSIMKVEKIGVAGNRTPDLIYAKDALYH